MDIYKLLPKGLKIESPFMWKLDQRNIKKFCEEKIVRDYENWPISCFIMMNTFAYIQFMLGKSIAAEEVIAKIDAIWDNIYESVSEQKVYSIDVLIHIKDATAFYIYSMIGKEEKAKEIERKIKDANDFKSDIEKATVFGCQAIATKLLNDTHPDISIELSKLASSYAPNCVLWHYITAECLRKKRRYEHRVRCVSEEEKNEYLKCYELSQSIDYGMSVARMYMESGNWEKCSEIYNEIYLKEPKWKKFRFILALFFIKDKDFVKAKNCLDYVKNTYPAEKRTKTYYHYLAKYYEANKDYPKAKKNYLKAIGETGNFFADIDYFNLIRNTSLKPNNYDAIAYLESMLKRYQDNISLTIYILLHIAITHLLECKNLKAAADYFLKAIKMNPCDAQFENFQSCITGKNNYNIYDLIRKKILSVNKSNNEDTLKKLANYCTEYEKKIRESQSFRFMNQKFSDALLFDKQ
ncbi:hypothetical protein TKK_0014928 [Trichogramma kaykai]